MSINLSALMKQRYDTAANWTAQNPTLLAGEIGIESDTKKWKVGTGATAWTSLVYAIGGTYPIVNADIAAGAEIAVSKLADGSARQLLQTDAAGTGVEWTSDVSIPGALSVTGNVNIDSNTLYVDAANNRVGVGTTPSAAFHVSNLSGGTPSTFIENAASTGDVLAGVRFLTHNGTSSTGQADIFATNNAWTYRNYGSNALVMNATGTGGAHLMASNASGVIKFSVGGDATGQERMRLTSTGLGFGTTSPAGKLHVNVASDTAAIFYSSGANVVNIAALNDAGNSSKQLVLDGSPLAFNIASVEKARTDSSGRLLVGTSSARSNFFNSATAPQFQIEGTGLGTTTASVTRCSADAFGPIIALGKSRNASVGGNTVVNSGDECGTLDFQGNDGTEFVSLATITGAVDGTPGANDMPGRLVFSTTADGAASPTEALRITNDRVLAYNQPTPATYAAAATLTVADLKTAIITYTGTAATLTLPTGTLTEGGFSAGYTNMAFEWSVINTGAGICTIGAATAHTIVGSATIAIGASARFASRRTAANTFVSYRLV